MEGREADKQEWIRLDPKIRDRMSKILVDLVDAMETSTTRMGMVRRLTAKMELHLPLRAFELGWGDSQGEFSYIRLLWHEGKWQVDAGELHSKHASLVWGAVQEKKVLVSLVSGEGRKQVILPFYEDARQPGYARFEWQKEEEPDSDLSFAMFEPLRRILMLGQKSLLTVERIAGVSRRAYRDNKRLRQESEQYAQTSSVIAVGAKMRSLMEQARRVARYDSTVLVRGESGTGKELLARVIHQMSGRERQPFIKINCGALPEGLIESELFGHEKGAFTGAVRRHVGCFERAHGGTLLLDEVAELPLAAQVKLLRVLQENVITRVGGEEPIQVDVRVIAATHQPIEELVDKKAFRADLFFRLNVFPLSLPPLRERQEDLPVLAHHILKRTARRLGCAVSSLSPADLVLFQSYEWPGNIRELENMLERSLILSGEGGPAFSSALRFSLSLDQEVPAVPLSFPGEDASLGETETGPLMSWEEATKQCIERALAATGGRIFGDGGAAELLGLRPTTLQSKMKKLKIERKDFV